MEHVLLVLIIILILVGILGASVKLGRHFGYLRIQQNSDHKLEVIGVAEGAVFGLLGLLIAFSFSGAYGRYEASNTHMLEEANTFDTAYQMIDFVPIKYQPSLRENVRKYLDLHIASYHHIPHGALVDKDLNEAIVVQHTIWDTLLTAREDPHDSMLEQVFPAISKMFEEFHTGINMTLIHPPFVIFILLIGLSALGAVLIGYIAAENREKTSIHIVAYVIITSLILYLIMNLEYPRLGLMRLSSFDSMLDDVREDMNYVSPLLQKK